MLPACVVITTSRGEEANELPTPCHAGHTLSDTCPQAALLLLVCAERSVLVMILYNCAVWEKWHGKPLSYDVYAPHKCEPARSRTHRALHHLPPPTLPTTTH